MHKLLKFICLVMFVLFSLQLCSCGGDVSAEDAGRYEASFNEKGEKANNDFHLIKEFHFIQYAKLHPVLTIIAILIIIAVVIFVTVVLSDFMEGFAVVPAIGAGLLAAFLFLKFAGIILIIVGVVAAIVIGFLFINGADF